MKTLYCTGMKKPLFLVLFLFVISFVGAKDAYNIKITLAGYANKSIKLAYYYGEKQYIKTESTTNAKGEVVFKGDSVLPVGVYLAVYDENNSYFEFLVEEQFFSIEAQYSETKSDNITQSLKAKNSTQNTAFFQYLQLISLQKKEADEINKQLEKIEKDPSKQDEVLALEKKLADIDAAIKDYQKGIVKNYKGKLFAKLILASGRPTIPAEITDKTARFYYYRNHFWNDFDFSYSGLLYTPAYQQRIKEYVNNLTVQEPDSVIQSVDYLIQQSKANKETFRYTLIWALNEYAKTKAICFDAVYVYIAQKYYETGQADWVDKEQLDKIIKNANNLSKILCGKKAADIKPKTETYATPSLYSIKAKYTAVFIWEIDCVQCKKYAQQLKKVYDSYKDKGFTIYSVELGNKKEQWKEYSSNENIGWINLHQSDLQGSVREDYNIIFNPQIFLLDENKKIVLKQLDAEQLDGVLKRYLN